MHLNQQPARNVTLDTCRALQFHLQARPNEASRSVIIWRGSRADTFLRCPIRHKSRDLGEAIVLTIRQPKHDNAGTG